MTMTMTTNGLGMKQPIGPEPNEVFDYIADLIAAALAKRMPRITSAAYSASSKRRITFGMSPDGIRSLVASGELPRIDLDRKFRFDVEDLDRMIERKRKSA